MQKHVLIIDDNTTNLQIAEKTLKQHYKVTLLISGEQALKFLKKSKPDLILLDIRMPGMDGFETIKKIKNDLHISDIPVIFLTAQSESVSEVYGLQLGAADFIAKPFVPEVMLRRVSMQMELYSYRNKLEQLVSEKTMMVEKMQDALVTSISELVEFRDKVTGGHAKRTEKYLSAFLQYLVKLPKYKEFLSQPNIMEDMKRAAPLHDVGKVGINDNILTKQSVLDNSEYNYMKQHTTLGGLAFEMAMKEVPNNQFLEIARKMALYHHEYWDGSGYPSGLKGEEIPLEARIMAIADVYDAMTTKRSYKDPFPHEDAVEQILRLKGVHFDPDLVDAFYEYSDEFKKICDSFKED